MSTDASRRDADEPGADVAPPLAADRPYVDGTAASPEELRAEVERLSLEERFHVDDLREELGDSVAELASRLDVKGRMSIKKDEAVAAVRQEVGRARSVVTDGMSTAKDTAQQRPGILAAVSAALLVLVLLVARRRRRG
jgi:hypothetical protein